MATQALPRIAAGLMACSLAACAAGDADDGQCHGKCDDLDAQGDTRLEAPGVVGCWVIPGEEEDPFFRIDELVCDYRAPEDYPIDFLGTTINGHSIADPGFRFGKSVDETHRDGVAVARFHPDAYPLEVRVDIHLDTSSGVSGLRGLSRVESTLVIDETPATTSEAPAVATMPFDLWEITLIGRSEEHFALSFDHELELEDGVHPVQFWSRPVLFGRLEKLLVPVSRDTEALAPVVAFAGGDQIDAELIGPGAYVGDDEAVFLADPNDEPSAAHGDILASCWIEPGERNSTLRCSRTGDSDIAELSLAVTSKRGVQVDAAFEDGEAIVAVSPEAFPLTIDLSAVLVEEVVGIPDAVASEPYVISGEIAADGARIDQPVDLRWPFQIWNVELLSEVDGFQGDLEGYEIELGADWNGRFAARIESAQTPFIAAGESVAFRLVAPIGAEDLEGQGFVVIGDDVDQSVSFRLRPGRQRITSDGLELM